MRISCLGCLWFMLFMGQYFFSWMYTLALALMFILKNQVTSGIFDDMKNIANQTDMYFLSLRNLPVMEEQ